MQASLDEVVAWIESRVPPAPAAESTAAGGPLAVEPSAPASCWVVATLQRLKVSSALRLLLYRTYRTAGLHPWPSAVPAPGRLADAGAGVGALLPGRRYRRPRVPTGEPLGVGACEATAVGAGAAHRRVAGGTGGSKRQQQPPPEIQRAATLEHSAAIGTLRFDNTSSGPPFDA